MAARHFLSVVIVAGGIVSTESLCERANGQVVIDMPPPPPSTAPMLPPVRASVDVGDVALYRYSGTRYAAQPMGPRMYEQYTLYDWPPYFFYGFTGTRYLPPPVRFHFTRPYPLRGFRFELH
jgi:hypothetical protein